MRDYGDRCPSCDGENLTVLSIGLALSDARDRRVVICHNCNARMYGTIQAATITADLIDASSVSVLDMRPPRCLLCGDALPDGARHCIACGAAAAVTGETQRLGSTQAPVTGKTMRLDEYAEEWRWVKVHERADFYERLLHSNLSDDETRRLSGAFEQVFTAAEQLAAVGAYREACAMLRRVTRQL